MTKCGLCKLRDVIVMNANSTLSQEVLNKRISDCIPAEAWESTVGIIIVVDKILHQFGTGTLFRVADRSFLVTVAHVIKGDRGSNLHNSVSTTRIAGGLISPTRALLQVSLKGLLTI